MNDDNGLAMVGKKLTFKYYITHTAPQSPSAEIRNAVKAYRKLLGRRRENTYLRDLDKSALVKNRKKAHIIRELSELLRAAYADHTSCDYVQPYDCDSIGDGCYVKRTHLGSC